MSAGSSLRTAGLAFLQSNSGEGLTYDGGAKVTALVNRRPTKIRDAISSKDGQLNFDIAGMTEIELSMGGLVPATGKGFTDSIGFRHRIAFVGFTDISWVMYCIPSKTA